MFKGQLTRFNLTRWDAQVFYTDGEGRKRLFYLTLQDRKKKQKNADILLLLHPHRFNFGFDFVCTTAQRELLQQVEILQGEFLLLLQRTKYLTRRKECSEDAPFFFPSVSLSMCYLVVAKWVSDVNMIVTLLNPLKIMWYGDSAFCLWK